MREPTFWILTALAGSPKHGYAILASVDELSGSTVSLKVPTLYAALDRMQKEGFIQVDHEETVDGRFRRYFALAPTGRLALKDEVERKSESVKRASFQLGINPAGASG